VVVAGKVRPLWTWIHTNHACNARLWAEEDLARRTRVSAQEIADNKRAIDGFNQARNDAIERIDELLLIQLGLLHPASGEELLPDPSAAGVRLNSETAGSMTDRLSILALKIRAMGLQVQRRDVGEEHLATCRARLARLHRQRDDLAACLDALLEETRDGRAYFKLYRQFKMYNDPRLNPVLVAEQAGLPVALQAGGR